MPHVTGVSVIIPAHNEEGSIGDLIEALEPGADSTIDLDLVVVCNGCSDRTALIAAQKNADARIFQLPEPSKRKAQLFGDGVAKYATRAYVDADVVLSRRDLERLVQPLRQGVALATAPERTLAATRSSWIVRRYYRIWSRLPQVRDGLFGRGVIVTSAQGSQRVAQLPPMLSDDLVMSEAFSHDERLIVEDARVVISLPRTTGDLLRRRIRIATGTAQADDTHLRSESAITSLADIKRLCREDLRRTPDVVVFLAVTAVSRVGARRRIRVGDFSTWSRDESSRVKD